MKSVFSWLVHPSDRHPDDEELFRTVIWIHNDKRDTVSSESDDGEDTPGGDEGHGEFLHGQGG